MCDDTMADAACRSAVLCLCAVALLCGLVLCCRAPVNPPSQPVLAEPLK